MEAKLGTVYESEAAYDPSTRQTEEGIVAAGTGQGIVYEPAYGDRNYNSLVGTDPATQETLDEAYRNTGVDTDLLPSSLEEVYARASVPATRTQAEIAEILRLMDRPVSQVIDQSGIRGVDDVDAPIEPVV